MQGEVIHISATSDNHINAMDMNSDYGDGANPVILKSGINTARLSVVSVLNASIFLTPNGRAVFSPSICWYFSTANWQRCFRAVVEMTNIILTDPNADVLVIDPEREYAPLVKAMQGEVIHIVGKHRPRRMALQ